ncbi:MAG TPA: ECF-type sigma factor [Rubricoccaceae bacterium]|nr:ECF-type sigma factor [Rubricoccaceae bacterium]
MSTPDVTRLLLDVRAGRSGAEADLLVLVYEELRALAQAARRRERDGHTLATTDLVHEAYLRLTTGTAVAWQDRSHFFAVAAQAMRRVLVDWARARHAQKRGNGVVPLSLDALAEAGAGFPADARAEEVLALDEALEHLGALSERQARVVECRYFAGLTIEETAAALGVSPATVKADWALARAWLHRALSA